MEIVLTEKIKKVDKTSSLPRHYQVSEQIKEAIRLCPHKKGDRIPTERELSEFFGVSRVTVRRALDSLVKENILEKEWSKGIFIKKPVLPVMRGTKKIGITMWQGESITYHPATVEVLRGIGEIFNNRENYVLEIVFVTPDMIRTCSYPEMINTGRLDGLISYVQEIPFEHTEKIRRIVPYTIFANRDFDNCVLIDYAKASCQVTRHLIGLGHRKIALLNGLKAFDVSAKVLSGYIHGLKEQNIQFNLSLVKNGYYDYKNGFDITMELFSSGEYPTALIAGDDIMALGALQALKQLGMHCPEDVSIVSFNDFPFSKSTSPPLSTVRIPYYELGKELAQLITDMVEGKQRQETRKVLEGEFIIRESTGSVSKTGGVQ